MGDTEHKAGPSIEIGGDVSGQIVVGDRNVVTRTVGSGPALSEAEREELARMFADLKRRVAGDAPDTHKQAALERVDELEQAVGAGPPDLTTIEYVKRWFVRNVPTLAGAVIGVVVNPLVGKLVEAGGEMLAAEFRRRLGSLEP